MADKIYVIKLKLFNGRVDNIVSLKDKDHAISYCEKYAKSFGEHGLTRLKGEDVWMNRHDVLSIDTLEYHTEDVYAVNKPKFKVGDVVVGLGLLGGKHPIQEVLILPPSSYMYKVNRILLKEHRIILANS